MFYDPQAQNATPAHDKWTKQHFYSSRFGIVVFTSTQACLHVDSIYRERERESVSVSVVMEMEWYSEMSRQSPKMFVFFFPFLSNVHFLGNIHYLLSKKKKLKHYNLINILFIKVKSSSWCF